MNLAATNRIGRLDSSSRILTAQSGLTLVEMLVALVLSSVIFVSSYLVISNLIQYQVRARVQNEEQLDKLLVINLASQIIEKGISQYDLLFGVVKESQFRGKNESLQVISRAYSGRYDRPGYRLYHLYVKDDELTITQRAFNQNFKSSEPVELATGLKINGISFEYFDKGNWLREWTDKKTIPEMIRVSIDFPRIASVQFVRGTGKR